MYNIPFYKLTFAKIYTLSSNLKNTFIFRNYLNQVDIKLMHEMYIPCYFIQVLQQIFRRI